LYPFIHPSNAQSQLTIHEPDVENFPDLEKAKAIGNIFLPKK